MIVVTVGGMDYQRTARSIARAALGHDPGPLTAIGSLSHQVFLGADVVVKIIGADEHTRLAREIALAPYLPDGLTAPLLDSGVHPVRYAIYRRAPGAAPGMGLPGIDADTACAMAVQAVRRLQSLHAWTPAGPAAQVLREPLDHGGFAGRAALTAELDAIADVLPPAVAAGVRAIAETAPPQVTTAVPVHADCHWGNWLACDGTVTALLDFEWARFGDPLDDWFFLISGSGPHRAAVLDVVARETGVAADVLRAECEARHVAYLAADVRLALADLPARRPLLTQRLTNLADLVENPW